MQKIFNFVSLFTFSLFEITRNNGQKNEQELLKRLRD